MIIDQTTIIQYRESIMLMTMFHVSVSRVIAYSIFLATSLVLAMMGRVHGFPQIDPSLPRRCRSQPPLLGCFQRPPCCCTRNVQLIRIFNAYNNFDESIGQERDDEDDDEYLNVDMLGDWRAFRRNLAASKLSSSSKSEENEALLKTQCEDLAREYVAEVWAHTAPMVSLHWFLFGISHWFDGLCLNSFFLARSWRADRSYAIGVRDFS